MNHFVQRITLLTIFVILFSAAAIGQSSRSRTEPLKVGDDAPAFTLTDQSGQQVTLSKTGNPVVLVFYRGFW